MAWLLFKKGAVHFKIKKKLFSSQHLVDGQTGESFFVHTAPSKTTEVDREVNTKWLQM